MGRPYYEDESVVIYHGDCREILPELPKVDLVLTDPPYGILAEAGSAATRRFSRNTTDGREAWDKRIDKTMCDQLLRMADLVMIWGGNHFELGPTDGWLVWDKQNDGLNFGECEYCWTNMQFAPRIHRQRCINIDGCRVHPTQKPVDLMRWCILECGGTSHLILDPFMGSGTTLRAAKDLGRKSIGIEIEERYCEIAAKRMSQMVMALA